MYKSPVRNPKSKGIKVKHVLQVCFLLAICFWLIYQVKHSHDKKKAFEETDAKKSAKSEPTGDTLKLGRKDPIVKDENPELINGKLHEEEVEDEETIGNDEENKNEEVTQDEDGDKADEVDEIDEHELEKDGEDSTDDNSLKEHDDEGEDEDENIENEAREVNYKADDASSAVTQTSQGVEISKDVSVNDNNSDSGGLKTTVSSTGGREMAEIDDLLNISINDVVEEVVIDKSNDGFLSEQSDSIHQRMDDPSQINTRSSGTETEAYKTLSKNLTLEDTTSKDVSAQSTDLHQVKNYESHDDTVVIKDSKNLTNSSEDVEGNMLSSDIKSNINNEDKPKKSDPNVLTMAVDVTPSYDHVDDVHNDPIDSSTSLEEKNDENDLEMLAGVVLNQDGVEDVATG